MGMKWTEEQSKVINLRDRNILVSAAAGSGKTAVLVQRILGRIMDPERPVDIDRLLIMTFTRAAAGEMKERISSAIDQVLYENPDNEHLQKQATLIHNAQITTIDGFCSYIIRNYFHMVELDPGYRTAEEGELKLLKEDVMKELLEEAYEKADPKFLSLVECYASGKSDDEIRDMVYKLYNAAMSHPFPEEWLEECMEVYRVETVRELRETTWFQLLWETLDEKVIQAEMLAESAVKLCREPDGPYFYEEALADDLNFWNKVRKCRESDDYDEMAELLAGHTFAKLPAKRDSSVNSVKKEQAKELRDEEKEICKELVTKFFNQKEEILLELIACAREPLEGLVELTLKFKEAFSAKKREKNLLDFTDMEHFALRILVEKVDGKLIPTQAARELSEKYEEVMVDEYQDSNFVQELITTMVSGWVSKRKNIFMVGDVKQSIYRFRLARPELFMEKYHSYSLEDSEEQRIDLHKNFRSRAQVLASVNYIFRQIMGEDLGGITYDDDNALYPGASFPEGEDPDFVRTEVLIVEKDGEGPEDEQGMKNAQEMEALAIAQRIQRMIGKDRVLDKETGEYREIRYGDIVILLRSAAGWSETFSQVLSSRGIPVYSASRTGYFSAQEVVTLLNYLRVCDNPLQDIPLTGVLYSPIVGCSVQELAMLRSENPKGMIYDSICAYIEKREEILEEDKEKLCLTKKLRVFKAQLQKIRDMAEYTPIHELIMYILKETGYGTYARAMPGGIQRGANLHMLVEKAMDYEKTSYRGLFNFIRYIEKLQKYEVDFGEVNLADAGSGAVQIMTIHKSKGLEFPVVFAAGMGKQFNFQDINAKFLIHPELGFGVDAVFPERRLIVSAMQKQIIRRALKRESLGEELRVLYVALTRAKEKLIITGSMGSIESALHIVSRYMDTEETLLPLGLRSEARSYWSYILPALVRHPAMKELLAEYGIFGNQMTVSREENAEFLIRKVTMEELVQGEILGQTDAQLREEFFREWDSNKIYDENIRQTLEEKFGFVYPHAYLENLPVKVSVSELKKRKYSDDEEKEAAVYPEKDPVEIVPAFISGEREVTGGAARGTAYHRMLECLDYTRLGSVQDISEQIQELVECHKMSPEEGSCIRRKDILVFAESELGKRMQKAAENRKLYREQPFVMKADMRTIDASWNGDETILVQGIIDAYFLEGDEIVLVDYKTDRIVIGEEEKLTKRYKVQLEEYALVLERILHKKVKQKYIYSFALHKAISV